MFSLHVSVCTDYLKFEATVFSTERLSYRSNLTFDLLDKNMELIQARVCSVLNLAANFASPVSSKIFVSGNGNSFISTETSVKPAFRTGDSSDTKGFVSSSCVLKYSGSVISTTSFCGKKTILV